MPVTCVVGLQWGDEAKGKIVDLLTERHEIVVRYQGGANAGHTIVRAGQTYKLSLMPSGIFRPEVRCVIAAGVVLNPAALIDEIDALEKIGVKVADNLIVSDRAHVIFPWHFEEDRLLERQCGGDAIGTTLRGIGPCYRDKVGRSLAVRFGDLYRPDFRARIERIVRAKNELFAALSGDANPMPQPTQDDALGATALGATAGLSSSVALGATAGLSSSVGSTVGQANRGTHQFNPVEPMDAGEIFERYRGYAERLRPHAADTTAFLLDAVEAGRPVLFEGAQGALLDIDHGTFPFVTSSNSSGVGVSVGSGVPGRYIAKVVGVIKAYNTRVGAGPFPTEQDNAVGEQIRRQGNEYGTVTRRPRRCGWFDAVAARYAARLSGADSLALMLLDVLGGVPELKICTAYELDGRRTTDFPSHVEDLRKVVPVYESIAGWSEDLSGATKLEDLPEAARRYVARIGELVGRPVDIVSVGPDRRQTIFTQQ